MNRTQVFCTLQVEGLHSWSDCDINEVHYLKHPHRHVFHIKAYADVSHGDRDIEFIKLKHEIGAHLVYRYGVEALGHVCNFGNKSCEMIAEELIEHFGLSACEVSEDNENGALVTANDTNSKKVDCPGCSDVDVDLTFDQQMALVESYIKDNLSTCSVQLFSELLNKPGDIGANLMNATFSAILNEEVTIVLTNKVQEMKNEA